MGIAKQEQIAREDNWRGYAESRGLRCDRCGELIGYDERELIGQRTCAHCKYLWAKAD